jgi:hypothetical protein
MSNALVFIVCFTLARNSRHTNSARFIARKATLAAAGNDRDFVLLLKPR